MRNDARVARLCVASFQKQAQTLKCAAKLNAHTFVLYMYAQTLISFLRFQCTLPNKE